MPNEPTKITVLRRFLAVLEIVAVFAGLFIAAALLGALGAIFITRKLFDKRPGLVLSAEGIVDNSSGVAAGLIPWSDIEAFNVAEIRGNKFIVVLVKDPEKYLQRGN
ncbi:MAG: STM3941 family protein, partial [Pseudomonadota bacterium]